MELSALRSGLQQICMFLTASEFFCPLSSQININAYAFSVYTLELQEDATTAEHPQSCFCMS